MKIVDTSILAGGAGGRELGDRPKPVVLLILDGWGNASPSAGNAVTLAKTPVFHYLTANFPTMSLLASGEAVGLSWGETGNSEVGHLTLGSGRIMFQNLPRITKAIRDGSFFKNEKFLQAMNHAKQNNSALHFMGLVSPGLVHSFDEHLYALLDMAKREGVQKVFVHAFVDGRDTVFNSGKNFIKDLLFKMEHSQIGKLASLSGRMFALDRDNRWERVSKVWQVMVNPEIGTKVSDPLAAIEASYANKVYDEEFEPVAVVDESGQPVGKIQDNDALIFFNFRADRAREICKPFIVPGFNFFDRGRGDFKNLYFVGMTEYEKGMNMEVAFPGQENESCLAKEISAAGLKQLHIAETEKYAHVTFFFNAGKEKAYPGEDRIVVPSPRVASYAEKPEMSLREVNDKLLSAIEENKYDFIVCNYANPDMVGHTGDLQAGIKAVEFSDKCLGELAQLVLNKNGVLLVTADHGNVEEMINLRTNEIDKEHSVNAVPFMLIGKQYQGLSSSILESIGNDLSLLTPVGVLSDVTVTVLDLLQVEPSCRFYGRSLLL